MDVLVLGPVEARLDGRSSPIGGAKQRALLSRLVVARGRPISPFRLCEELWTEDSPRNPAHALQARISRLRLALPTLDIELTNGGYRLEATRIRTDTVRFEKLREEGGWLLADGALVQAAERLNESLDLWRGPAFTDVPYVLALQAESARLEKLRVTALADRIDIDLALGREAAVIPELAALVKKNPLFERHWTQLLAALYRSGQVQEALDVYARARAMTVERLGVEPSGELGQQHLKILREQPSETLLRLPVATPVLTPPAADDGWHPALDGAITSNSSDALARMLWQHRALIVTGPTGIGKTHLLRAVRSRFEAQHCLAPLLSASTLSRSTPLGVFAGVAGSLSDGGRTPAALIDFFARHRSSTVLLVDNAEMLDDSSLFVITQLISTSRVPTIVVTRSITDAPAEIRALYDSGELIEVAVDELCDVEAHELAVGITGGPLTPKAQLRILAAAAGNPFHVREIVTGSLADGRLVQTEHGWELNGDPAMSPRLAQLAGARFELFDDATVEAAALVAIAGEYPAAALADAQRRILARADVLALGENGWLRLAEPLDREILRARCTAVMWQELTREVVQVLQSELAAGVPQAQRRADLLALEIGDVIDIPATLALAEEALGAFDERLALRAAETVIKQSPDDTNAFRLAGVAASVLGMTEAAEAHFDAAHRHAASAAALTAVALAEARHRGLRLHDAMSALAIIDKTLDVVEDPAEVQHLQRERMRWAAVAGMGGVVALGSHMTSDAADALGLIMVGVSGVVTGPLSEAHRTLKQLRQVPDHIVELVPGGRALIELTEIMALSNSGDVLTAQLQLRQKICEATAEAPETLGQWEYALGFTELFSGDATQAHSLAAAAVEHLAWRDPVGLLPAAQALSAASAQAIGACGASPLAGFEVIPAAAANDPKVVMLRGWAEARQARSEGHTQAAARTLIQTAQWLLAAQHTYFAGILAHCAIRTGYAMTEALAVLNEAHTAAGGGLLTLFLRHGEASLASDLIALNRIAREARELGLAATAADTWTALAKNPDDELLTDRLQYQCAAIEELYVDKPGLVGWTARPLSTRPISWPREWTTPHPVQTQN